MPQAKVNGKTVHLPYNKAGRDLARRLARGPFTDEMKQRLKALAEASKQEGFATLQQRLKALAEASKQEGFATLQPVPPRGRRPSQQDIRKFVLPKGAVTQPGRPELGAPPRRPSRPVPGPVKEFTDEMKQRLKARPSRPVPGPVKEFTDEMKQRLKARRLGAPPRRRPREKPIATAVKLAKSGKTDAAIDVARASIGLPPLKKKKR